MDMGNACFHSMPGLNNDEPAEFFRILRVAYVRPIGDILAVDIPVIYPFTYESFMPELIRHKEYQPHQQQQPTATATVTAANAMTSSTVTSLTAAVNGGSKERMERMKETFAKVIAFLRNSGKCLPVINELINVERSSFETFADS
jgi:hypothetical protein